MPSVLQSATGSTGPNYGIGTTSITTQEGSWLTAFVGWNCVTQGQYAPLPAVSVTDNAGNLWEQAGISTGGGTATTRCAVWVTANALPVSWVSVGVAGFSTTAAWTVTEISGMPQAAVSDFCVSTAGSGTAPSLTGIASSADIGFAVVMAGLAPETIGPAPAGWTALTSSSSGTVVTPGSTGSTVFPYWNPSLGAGTATTAVTLGTSAPYSYALCALSATASPPPQYSQDSPLVTVEAAFGATPGNYSASADYLFSGEYVPWTDISNRVIGPALQGRIKTSRGRQYQLTQEEAGKCDITLNNVDGALTPTSPGSPFYSNAINENMSFQPGISPWHSGGPPGIAYRDSAESASSGQVAALAITIPATVQVGDYVVFVAGCLKAGAAADTVTASSTGTTPSPLTSTQYMAGPSFGNARSFGFTASASDAGKVITVTTVSGITYFMGIALSAYSGCTGTDVIATPAIGSAVPLASPTAVTATAGDWGVCMVVTTSATSTSFSSTPYAAVRQIANTNRAALCDSNGSVGNAGSTIGSGNWNWSASGFNAVAFTVGLQPAPGASAASSSAYAYATGLNADASLSMQVTPDSSGDSTAGAEQDAINPNYPYSASAWLMSPGGWTSGGRVQVSWFTSAHAYISTTTGISVALPAGQWAQAVSLNMTPPSGAAYGSLIVSLSGSPGPSNVYYVAEAALVIGSSAVQTGLVAIETPIRVTAWWQGRRYPLWMGYAERWPQSWPDMPQWGFSKLTAADALSVAGAGQMQSALIGEVLIDAPYAYLPCNESYTTQVNGATPSNPFIFSGGYFQPADASGLPAVDRANGNQIAGTYLDGNNEQVSTGLAMNFLGDNGTGMGATGYSGEADGAGGPAMTYSDPGLAAVSDSAGGFSLEFWFLWGGTASSNMSLLTAYGAPSAFQFNFSAPGQSNGAAISVTIEGGQLFCVTNTQLIPPKATAPLVTPSSSVPQYVAVTFGPGSSPLVSLYLNGTFAGSATATLPSFAMSAVTLGPGRYSYDCLNGSGFYAANNYSAGHLAIYGYQLSAERISAHYQAGSQGWQGVTAAYRFAQILTWAQLGLKRGGYLTSGATGNAEITRMGPAYQLSGAPAADAIYSAAQSEGGQYQAQANGTLTYLERDAGYNQQVQATFSDSPAAPAPQVLNPNPDFTGTVTPWTGSAATLTYVTSPSYGNPGAALITPAGTATAAYALSPQVPVTPGASYTAMAWVYSPGGWGTVQAGLTWYNGTAVSSSAAGFNVPGSAWTCVTTTRQAPGSAVTAAVLTIGEGGTPGTANTLYIAYGAMWQQPAAVPYLPKSSYGFDNTYIYNEAAATQQDGPNQLITVNSRSPASQQQYFRRSALTFQPEVLSPYDVSDVTTWSLAEYAQPSVHVSDVTVDAASNPLAAFGVVLSQDITDIAQVNRNPVGGAPLEETGITERVQHDIGPGYWRTTYQLSPYGPAQGVLCADTPGYDQPATTVMGW